MGAERYIELERRLLELRERAGEDSPEEESLLEEMDEAWYALTPDEVAVVEARTR